MKTKLFLSRLDDDRIVNAIAQAEARTSGEIRVFVTHKEIREAESALERAKARFLKLGMDKTRDRNAVLIYFAPRSRQFAVVGDTAVHAQCGDAFWQLLTATMGEALREQRFTEAVVTAVEKCGTLLAEHFPRRPDDTNELPNEVERD